MPPAVKGILGAWAQPTTLLAAAGLVISNLVVVLWWASSQSALITANAVAIGQLKGDVFAMNTPLSGKVLQLESRQQALTQQLIDIASRVDRMDNDGTRKLNVVIEPIRQNQARNISQIERLAERLLETDKRINELLAAATNTVGGIRAQLATLEANVKKLDERVERLERGGRQQP